MTASFWLIGPFCMMGLKLQVSPCEAANVRGFETFLGESGVLGVSCWLQVLRLVAKSAELGNFLVAQLSSNKYPSISCRVQVYLQPWSALPPGENSSRRASKGLVIAYGGLFQDRCRMSTRPRSSRSKRWN